MHSNTTESSPGSDNVLEQPSMPIKNPRFANQYGLLFYQIMPTLRYEQSKASQRKRVLCLRHLRRSDQFQQLLDHCWPNCCYKQPFPPNRKSWGRRETGRSLREPKLASRKCLKWQVNKGHRYKSCRCGFRQSQNHHASQLEQSQWYMQLTPTTTACSPLSNALDAVHLYEKMPHEWVLSFMPQHTAFGFPQASENAQFVKSQAYMRRHRPEPH